MSMSSNILVSYETMCGMACAIPTVESVGNQVSKNEKSGIADSLKFWWYNPQENFKADVSSNLYLIANLGPHI